MNIIFKWQVFYYGKYAKINNIEKPYNFILPIIKKTEKNKIEQNKAEKNKNSIIYKNDHIIILIKHHEKYYECIIDEIKYVDVSKYIWHISNGYASTHIKNKIISMHRFLINAEEETIVDHINNNKLDNRIENLRIVNRTINSHNRISKNKYKGVYKTKNGFDAKLMKNGIKLYLGSFKSENEAALAVNKKLIELYGNLAKLNIVIN